MSILRLAAMLLALITLVSSSASAKEGTAGAWWGHYGCEDRGYAFELTIEPPAADGTIAAVITATNGRRNSLAQAALGGRWDPESGTLTLHHQEMLSRRDMHPLVDLRATLTADGFEGTTAQDGITCGIAWAWRLADPVVDPNPQGLLRRITAETVETLDLDACLTHYRWLDWEWSHAPRPIPAYLVDDAAMNDEFGYTLWSWDTEATELYKRIRAHCNRLIIRSRERMPDRRSSPEILERGPAAEPDQWLGARMGVRGLRARDRWIARLQAMGPPSMQTAARLLQARESLSHDPVTWSMSDQEREDWRQRLQEMAEAMERTAAADLPATIADTRFDPSLSGFTEMVAWSDRVQRLINEKDEGTRDHLYSLLQAKQIDVSRAAAASMLPPGDFPDTIEGLQALKQAVHETFRQNAIRRLDGSIILQRGADLMVYEKAERLRPALQAALAALPATADGLLALARLKDSTIGSSLPDAHADLEAMFHDRSAQLEAERLDVYCRQALDGVDVDEGDLARPVLGRNGEAIALRLILCGLVAEGLQVVEFDTPGIFGSEFEIVYMRDGLEESLILEEREISRGQDEMLVGIARERVGEREEISVSRWQSLAADIVNDADTGARRTR